MRSYGSQFAAEILKPRALPFFTAVYHFPSGDVWVSGIPATVGGIAHTVILESTGTIGSTIGRREPSQWDIANCDLTFANLPMPAGGAGQLSTGQRLIDRWPRVLTKVLAEIYLNFKLDDGTGSIVREVMMPGVIQYTGGVGFVLGSTRVSSIAELYLNAAALRKTTTAAFPFIRLTDSGRTVPVVHGRVPRCLGRVAKELVRAVGVPVAPESNGGTIQLGSAIANGGAVAETWTLTFSAPETQSQLLSDGEYAVGSRRTLPSYDNAASFSTGSSKSTSFSNSFTVGSGASLMLVQISWNEDTGFGGSSQQPSAVTFNGVALGRLSLIGGTLANTGSQHVDSAVWWLPFPASGAHNLVVTFPASTSCVVNVVTFLNASVASLPTSPGFTQNNAASSISYNSSGAIVGDIIVDFIAQTPSTATPSVFAGQTQRAIGATSFGGINNLRAGISTKAVSVAGTQTTGWNTNSGSAEDLYFQIRLVPFFDVYSQGIQTTGTQALVGVRVLARRNPAYTLPSLVGISATVMSDVAGVPAETGSFGGTATVTSTAASWITIPIANATIVGGTPKHIAFTTAGPDSAGNAPIFIGKKASAAYSNGVANHGELAQLSSGRIHWLSDLPAATDLAFELLFASGSFTADGSVSGPQGSGSTVADFTSTNTRVTVKATEWSGTPAGGDIIQFTIDLGDPWVIFSESPQATPVSEIRDVYFDDGSTITLNPASIVAKDLSVDDGTGHYVARVTFDADIPQNTRVLADIVGITDDVSGTYSGTAGQLLTNPADVALWWFARAGVPPVSIDAAGSFATSKAAYGTLFAFNGVVQNDESFKQVLLRYAYECSSVMDWRLLAQLKFIPDTYPDPVRTFTFDDILRGSDNAPGIELVPMGADELCNSLTMRFNREPASSDYQGAVARFAPDSVKDLGLLERTDFQPLEFVRSKAHARAIADLILKRRAFPAWRAKFTTLLPFADMEPDDPVGLDLRNPFEGSEALGGWDGSQTFQIESANPQPMLPGMDFVLFETGISVNIRDGDGTNPNASIAVLKDQADPSILYDVDFGADPIATWTTPSATGGTPFDGIQLAGGWVIYMNNGDLTWSQVVGPTTNLLTWGGSPGLSIDIDETLIKTV